MKPPVKPAFQPPESRAGSAATGLTQGNARPAFPAVLRRNELSAQERKSPGQTVARGSVVAGREPRRPAGTAHLSAPNAHGGFFAARQKMLQQLMRSGVTDPRVLAAMSTVERHRFVDTALASQGYEDTSLPIGLGQTISKPNVVARMLELLCADSTTKLGRVLEIGTGCGYQAAVLSHLASEVYSIERLRGLHERAIDNLRFMRLPNVHLLFGDGMLGYPRGAPYAAIIAAAGGEAIPAVWIDQLAVGGRLVAPVKVNAGEQALVLVKKTARGVTRSQLEPVQFVPLKSGTSA